MIGIVRTYFKDETGRWHQPGNQIDLDDLDHYERLGFVKIIRTQMVEPPQTRRRGRRKKNA